jgi:hypothetical protein
MQDAKAVSSDALLTCLSIDLPVSRFREQFNFCGIQLQGTGKLYPPSRNLSVSPPVLRHSLQGRNLGVRIPTIATTHSD